MSPLKIILLMQLHTAAVPMNEYPREQWLAQAMTDAFADFAKTGLLREGITHSNMCSSMFSELNMPRLTEKGLDLVRRFINVEIDLLDEIEALHAKIVAKYNERAAQGSIDASAGEAELFAAYCKKQFHHDPAPVRCTDCGPTICWQDSEVAKHWLTWKAARTSAAQGSIDADLRTTIGNAIHGYGAMLEDHSGVVDAIARAVADRAAKQSAAPIQPAPPELFAAINKVVRQNQVNGIYISLSDAIVELGGIASRIAPTPSEPELAQDSIDADEHPASSIWHDKAFCTLAANYRNVRSDEKADSYFEALCAHVDARLADRAARQSAAPGVIIGADEKGGMCREILHAMYAAFQRGDSVERAHAAVMAIVDAAPAPSEPVLQGVPYTNGKRIIKSQEHAAKLLEYEIKEFRQGALIDNGPSETLQAVADYLRATATTATSGGEAQVFFNGAWKPASAEAFYCTSEKNRRVVDCTAFAPPPLPATDAAKPHVDPVAWAVVSNKGGIHKLSITRESAERKLAKWLQEWPDNLCCIRPLIFGGEE